MYNILLEKYKTEPSRKNKWNYAFHLSDKNWATIFKIPYIVTKDIKFRWFQHGINHCILGSNYLVHKIDNSHSENALFVTFWECSSVQDLLLKFDLFTWF